MPETDVFAALASPVRRQLLGLLRERDGLAVAELASHFAMQRPSVSEHLKVLLDAGLVTESRSGRQRYYAVRADPLQDLVRWLSPYEQFWRGRFTTLRELLDGES